MKKNKKPKWDGKSRISNSVYRRRFNEIFGRTEQDKPMLKPKPMSTMWLIKCTGEKKIKKSGVVCARKMKTLKNFTKNGQRRMAIDEMLAL